MQINRAYMVFYFEGRDDELDQDDLDLDDLAEKCLAGPDDPHTVVKAAVERLAAPLEHDREKREWVEDYREQIDEAGGDADEAYRHFVKGRIDETVSVVEDEVLEIMDPRVDEDSEDDEDEDDEDEGDDGD